MYTHMQIYPIKKKKEKMQCDDRGGEVLVSVMPQTYWLFRLELLPCVLLYV